MKTISPTLQHLVEILNDGELHSGHDLSLALKISRNAVWKHINQLSKYGIEIETIQSTGYRLKTPLMLLDKAKIQHLLQDPTIEVQIFGSIPSTQSYFKKNSPSQQFEVCLAEYQTQGYGRFSRAWVAPFGSNILLSCRFLFNQDLSDLGGLSLCVGLAVSKVLASLGIEDLACKWPNDVLYQNQKLAGVLIEVKAEAHGMTDAIIGIGINVNMSEIELAKVDRPITSLQAILGLRLERNQIASLLITSLKEYLQRFSQKGFADFKTEWEAHDILHNQEITLNFLEEQIRGIMIGIDASGHLLMKLQSGEIKAFSAGEVSLSKQ